MLENILRYGRRFQDGFKSARWLGGVGHVEVYRQGAWSGMVFVHIYHPSKSVELTGCKAALVRGIMAMQ